MSNPWLRSLPVSIITIDTVQGCSTSHCLQHQSRPGITSYGRSLLHVTYPKTREIKSPFSLPLRNTKTVETILVVHISLRPRRLRAFYSSKTLNVIPALFNLSRSGVPIAVAVVSTPPLLDANLSSSRARQSPHSASIF